MHRNTFAGSCRACSIGLIVVAVLIPASLLAQSPTVPTFTAGKLDASAEAPVIDGRVNEAVWLNVPPYSTFTQQDPIEGAPASEKTEVRIIVEGNVYISIIASTAIRRRSSCRSRRDVNYERDRFGGDGARHLQRSNAFVFGTNRWASGRRPGGAREQTSGISLGGGTARGHATRRHRAFNPTRTVTGRSDRRSPSGWEAEMIAKTLRYQTGTDRTWGFNVSAASAYRTNRCIAPIRAASTSTASRWRQGVGLDLPAPARIKLIPYALGSVNKDFTRASDDQVDPTATSAWT